MIKILIEKILGKIGYEIRPIKRGHSFPDGESRAFPENFVQAAMLGFLVQKSQITILQIGANDGKVNDPIFNFCQKYKNETFVVLIEPQVLVAKKLRENYKSHPNANIIIEAFGDGRPITLYSVKPEFWSQLEIPYASDWPDYRAATGVTSEIESHIVSWLVKYGSFTHDSASDAIEKTVYPTITTESICEKYPECQNLDLLQVDVEGADDRVTRLVLDAGVRPFLINFESFHLSQDNLEAFVMYLQSKGYECFTRNKDTFCVLRFTHDKSML